MSESHRNRDIESELDIRVGKADEDSWRYPTFLRRQEYLLREILAELRTKKTKVEKHYHFDRPEGPDVKKTDEWTGWPTK